jgi:hypothetical protein
MILAELRGDSFGQGSHTLAAGENALVLFMLVLHTGVLSMILFVAWFTYRSRKRLPAETEALLDELELGSPPVPTGGPDTPRQEWEQDADWWKPSSDPPNRPGS